MISFPVQNPVADILDVFPILQKICLCCVCGTVGVTGVTTPGLSWILVQDFLLSGSGQVVNKLPKEEDIHVHH